VGIEIKVPFNSIVSTLAGVGVRRKSDANVVTGDSAITNMSMSAITFCLANLCINAVAIGVSTTAFRDNVVSR